MHLSIRTNRSNTIMQIPQKSPPFFSLFRTSEQYKFKTTKKTQTSEKAWQIGLLRLAVRTQRQLRDQCILQQSGCHALFRLECWTLGEATIPHSERRVKVHITTSIQVSIFKVPVFKRKALLLSLAPFFVVKINICALKAWNKNISKNKWMSQKIFFYKHL